MEKERRIKTISLIALIVAVVGLTVAFASLSTTLTINGSGSIDSASWDVHFENLSSAKTKGSGRQVSAPSISEDGLTVQNINVALSKPKDEVEYTVDIKNDGTINAEITSIEKSTLTSEQEKYFEFTATYKDGSSVEESNVINAKDKEQVIIRVRFKDNINANDLPKTAQTINLSLKLNYVQSDNVKVTTNQTSEKIFRAPTQEELSQMLYIEEDNSYIFEIWIYSYASGSSSSSNAYMIFDMDDDGNEEHYIFLSKDNDFEILLVFEDVDSLGIKANRWYQILSNEDGEALFEEYHGNFEYEEEYELDVYSQSYLDYVMSLFD